MTTIKLELLASKTQTTKLNGVINSAKNQRDKIQELITSGMAQVDQHGQLTYLSTLVLKTQAVRSINTKAMREYILAHVANITWSKSAKTGDYQFSKVADKSKKITVTTPTCTWFEYNKPESTPTTTTSKFDVNKRVASFTTSLTKAIDTKTVTQGNTQAVKDLLTALKAYEQATKA